MKPYSNRLAIKRWLCITLAIITIATSLGITASTVALTTPMQAAVASPHGQPQQPVQDIAAFNAVHGRTDVPVVQLKARRSFYWGFNGTQPFYERYDQGPEGRHLVQYYDKARMEINNPNGNRNDPFYVTNGHLSRELVTGRVQVGNNEFVQLQPANIDIASDTEDISSGTPTYASFRNLIRANPQKVGDSVSSTVDRAGLEGLDPNFGIKFNVRYSYYEPATKNNIPDVFWDFLNLTGTVFVDNKYTTARLSDPYFYVTGYPISGAYWAKVTIAGKPNTEVLIQVYERRVLTYVPSAPEGWRVQMGNVGMHYLEWRYRRNLHGITSYCDKPSGKTGEIWFAHPELQQRLGCIAGTPERGVTIAHQRFERGEMLDVIESRGFKTIYALFNDSTAQPFRDDYVDGSPLPAPVEPIPPCQFVPTGGFGKVWREANLYTRLGCAVAPETVTIYDPSTEPPLPPPVPTALPGQPTPVPPKPQPTLAPPSNRGFPAIRSFGTSGVGSNLIIYAGPNLKKFYTTSEFGTRWASYADTTGE